MLSENKRFGNYLVNLVESGGRLGTDSSLINNSEEALLEFYTVGLTNEFLTRYSLSTLEERTSSAPLMLDGSRPNDVVTHEELRRILQWAQSIVDPEGQNQAGLPKDCLLGVDLNFSA